MHHKVNPNNCNKYSRINNMLSGNSKNRVENIIYEPDYFENDMKKKIQQRYRKEIQRDIAINKELQ